MQPFARLRAHCPDDELGIYLRVHDLGAAVGLPALVAQQHHAAAPGRRLGMQWTHRQRLSSIACRAMNVDRLSSALNGWRLGQDVEQRGQGGSAGDLGLGDHGVHVGEGYPLNAL